MKIRLKAILRLIFSGFILVPSLVLLCMGYWAVSTFARRTMTEQIGVLAYSKTAAVENILSSYKSEIAAASLLDAIAQTTLGMYNEAKSGTDSYISTAASGDPFILDIVITDKNGVIIADHAGKGVGNLFAGFSEEITSLGIGETYLSDIHIRHSDYDGKSIFFLTGPVVSEDSITGYISFAVLAEAFDEVLRDGQIFDGGKLAIVDRKGNAAGLTYNVITRFEEIDDGKFRELVGKIKGVINSGTAQYQSFSAGRYIGVYNNIPGYEWQWVGIYPNSEIRALYSGYFLAGTIILMGIAVAALIVSLYLSNMTISPIHEMIATMDLLNNGNLQARFDIQSNNECGKMAVTFNNLIDEVLISEELHHTISNISDNILFEWDFQKERMFVSDNFPPLFDINVERSTLLNGRFIDSLMEEEDAMKYKQDINKLIKTKSKLVSEYLIKTKQNYSIWFSVRALCVTNRTDDILRVVGVITNIDSEKKLTLQLSERASFDFLSKLYNRNTFMRELEAELVRDASAKHAVVFIDVDDFKNINDQFGHATGDNIIKHVSTVIKSELKNNGFAGRFGGDEFVMCVNKPAAVENVETMVSQLIDIYNEGYFSEEHNTKIKVKISIGIAKFPEHGRSGEMLIAAADEAMYFVKKNGKSNYHVYDPNDSNLSNIMRTL